MMENQPTEENPERHTPGLAGGKTRTTTTTTTTSGGNISEGTASVNDDDSQYLNIPSELKELRQWVGFKLVPQPKGKKPKKVPINPANGKEAAVNNPKSWGTFAEAVAAVTRFTLDGVGFVFTANDPYAGIDLDGGCRDPTTGTLEPWALDIMKRLDSYTEASVSRTGVHILAKGKLPGGGAESATVEMYDHGRYFVTTGEHLGGTPPEIEERQGAIDTLYTEHFPHKLNSKATQDKPKKASAKQAATLQEVASALKVLPAVEHEDWLRVGMAIHSLDSGEDGFALWVEWSKSCPEKFDLDDCHTRWRSFSPDGGVTAATIFGLARDHGWKNTAAREPPAPDWNEDETPEEHEADDTQGEDGEPSATARRDFHLTDLGNGERLVASYGENLRYCNPWSKWLAWDGTRWRIDQMQQVNKWGRATVRALYQECSALVQRITKETDKKKRTALIKQNDALLKHAVNSENGARVKAMLTFAQMDVPIMPEALDLNPWLLNVQNGTLDLRTGTLRPHERADLLTKYIPIAYDPDARCPQWEDFLDSIMNGKPEVINFLQSAIGYSLTGDVREDCIFLLHGSGANGKSTFLKTLRALFADYGKQAPFSTFLVKDKEAVPNDLAALQGARLVVASETEDGKRMSMAVVKALTGRESVPARFLFKEFFEYAPQMKIWLGANHKPVITGTDHASWRRIRLIPFTKKFEGESDDKSLGKKLEAESPGILAWTVRGCLTWQAEGLPTPEAVMKATGDYRKEMDVIGNFLEECCVLNSLLRCKASDLYNAYVTWSGDKFIKQTSFGRLLTERGIEGKKESGIVWRFGIALTTEGTAER
jgi:putative DNA primase/helicase